MAPSRVPAALLERLGNDATFGLMELLDNERDDGRERVLSEAADRFERRLTQEVGAVRVELAQSLAGVRQEIAASRVEFLRWSFVFWIGQVATIGGMLAFLLRNVK
jgi:hypothetical protein